MQAQQIGVLFLSCRYGTSKALICHGTKERLHLLDLFLHLEALEQKSCLLTFLSEIGQITDSDAGKESIFRGGAGRTAGSTRGSSICHLPAAELDRVLGDY